MWVFFNDAFLSIVDKAERPGCLVVRARRKGDIETVFPDAEVVVSTVNDYRFRAEISRREVAAAIAERAKGIDYPNFKGSIKDWARHRAYADVWRTMERYQAGLISR